MQYKIYYIIALYFINIAIFQIYIKFDSPFYVFVLRLNQTSRATKMVRVSKQLDASENLRWPWRSCRDSLIS